MNNLYSYILTRVKKNWFLQNYLHINIKPVSNKLQFFMDNFACSWLSIVLHAWVNGKLIGHKLCPLFSEAVNLELPNIGAGIYPAILFCCKHPVLIVPLGGDVGQGGSSWKQARMLCVVLKKKININTVFMERSCKKTQKHTHKKKYHKHVWQQSLVFDQ